MLKAFLRILAAVAIIIYTATAWKAVIYAGVYIVKKSKTIAGFHRANHSKQQVKSCSKI
jgi:hypothetical protein